MKSKTTKSLAFIIVLCSILIYSCSPAGITSGTYNGTYTGDSLPDDTGNGTITITTNGQLVDVKFESPGNPTIVQTGVTVIDEKPYGGSNFDFNFDNGVDYLEGVYHPDETKYLDIAGNQGQYSFHFTGTKQ